MDMPEVAEVRGLVFVCGRNGAAYVERCLASLAAQQGACFDVLYVDDASTDGSGELAARLLPGLLPGRHELVRSAERKGKARHAYELLRQREGHDFVAIVDADDELIDPLALSTLARAYVQGFDIVWTDFVTDTGLPGGNGPLDAFDSPRTQGWQSSHLFSFRRLLIDRVPVDHFKDSQGQWLDAACDFAIAYPLLDQTRRYLFVPTAAYRYTCGNPQSHHNQAGPAAGLSSQRQRDCAAQVLAKPALACWRPVHEHAAAMNSAVGVKLHQMHVDLAQCFQRIDGLERQVQAAPFRQIALQRLALQEHVPLPWLRQAGEWALDAGLLDHLAGVLDRYERPRVLEYGSGLGSKTLARLVGNRQGTLVCVEHDEAWAGRTRGEFRQWGLEGHARVEHCPLVPVEFFGHHGLFYDMSFLQDADQFDVVIIDGPPARTCALARLPGLPALARHLPAGGFHVFLDDHERAEEQEIVRIWQSMVPELRVTPLVFDKGVCEITVS